MSEELQNPDSTPEMPRVFGEDVRLHSVIAKEINVETRNTEEWCQIDIWRHLNKQLMHELTYVGIYEEPGPGASRIVTVSNSHDREELIQELLDLVAKNRFKPSHGLQLHYDHSAVERECDIQIGSNFWSMREPFVEYWQGHYQPDAARLGLLKRIVDLEKQRGNEDEMLDERIWWWVERYFHGCCPQEVEVPQGQDPSTVLEIFDRDIDFALELPLDERGQHELLRLLHADFINGEYPIVVGKVDIKSEQAMQKAVAEAVHVPDDPTQMFDMRPISIVLILQRYRQYLAQDLDFEEEEEKLRQEMQAHDRMYLRDHERRREDLTIEMNFLNALNLPEWEAKDWPESLRRTANSPYFKVNPSYREHVHNHIHWLIERMPWEGELTPHQDPWGTLTCLLKDYWIGRYYPDPLRWQVLQAECKNLPAGTSVMPDGNYTSTFLLHDKFIRGSNHAGAKFNCKQDSEQVQIAYERDMLLIRGLNLEKAVERRSEWAYNNWLLEGKFPIAVNRELPKDRNVLEAKLLQHLEEMKGTEIEADPVMILQIFCDHWHPISKRAAPHS